MKKILVVVDMQNDFISGSLGTNEATQIVNNVIEKINLYRNENNPIIATKDTHFNDTYLISQEGVNLPVKHCIKETWGWELADGIKELINSNEIYEKNAFGSVEAMSKVAELSKDDTTEVEFIGLCTDICVISNVVILKALAPEVKVIVDSNCCAGVSPESHNRALESMKTLQVSIK